MIDRLLRQLKNRGLEVRPGRGPGQLLLAGPAAEKTPEIMAAVKAFKPQLLERFGAARPDPTGGPREDTVTTDPKVPAPRETGPTVPETPRYCPMCAALVLAVPATVTEAFCENPLCHYRGRTGSRSSPG